MVTTSGKITQQEVVDPYRRARLEGPELEPEGPRAEVGFPTADQGFSSIQGTLLASVAFNMCLTIATYIALF